MRQHFLKVNGNPYEEMEYVMKIIDLEAHFYTEDYIKYLRSRKETPWEEVRQKDIRLLMAPGLWGPT